MGRKAKYSKEFKVKICEEYKNGKGSFGELASCYQIAKKSVLRWYYTYLEHGSEAFDHSNRNSSYTQEFKNEVINEYLSGKHSTNELGAKYKISDGMISIWIKNHYNGIENKKYDPKGEVYTMKSRKTTFEERLEIVKWVIANDMNYKEAADQNAINYALIYQWVKKYLKEGEEGLKFKKRGPRKKAKVEESTLSEVERLKLELEREKALRERAEFRLELFKKRRVCTEKTLSKVKLEDTYNAIDYYKDQGHSVITLCSEFDVSRSGYYKHKNRAKPSKEMQDELLCTLILEYHAMYDGILGYRRMTMFINRLNQTSYSEGYIYRLMKHLSVTARIRKKKVNRKKSKPDYIGENILARDFKANKPNEKWLTDVTEFKIPNDTRKLYLSPIMDLYDNSIIEYELSFRNSNHFVFKMFDKAIENNPGATPIFHSDRGFSYTNNVFKSKLEAAGMVQSMSRVGKCIDNGPMEGFFGILKSEMFYDKKFRSMEDLIA